MKYHLFISYSSKDRPWAQRLESDLRKLEVKCFFDQLELRKGEKWEPNLLNHLVESRHFVVLWSDSARESDWVSEELVRFKRELDPNGTGANAPGRLLYAINLKGQNATLSAYQAYSDQNIQNAYTTYAATPVAENATAQLPPFNAATEQAWNRMVAEIAASVRAGVAPVPVQVSVLALTTAILQQAPPILPEYDFVTAANLDMFLKQLGVEGMSDLTARYGEDPFAWRPFGTDITITDLLNQLLSDSGDERGINTKLAELNQPAIRWVQLDVIKPPVNQLKQVVKPLLTGPGLIIIDPVSLFSERIWRRYVELKPCFLNPQAAIVFLTPFAGAEPLVFLRRCLTEQGRPNLDWFHDPIPYNPIYANCGINIADRWDIRRLVLASLGRQPHAKPPSGAEPILGA